jgi:hypothetical protein
MCGIVTDDLNPGVFSPIVRARIATVCYPEVSAGVGADAIERAQKATSGLVIGTDSDENDGPSRENGVDERQVVRRIEQQS